MVLKAGRYYGRKFRIEREIIQVRPVYPPVFTIVVDAVVRVVML